MTVRQAQPTDIEQLSTLFNGYRVFYRKESDLEAAKQFLSERFESNDSEIYVCESSEGQLMGFTQLYPLFSSVRLKRLWLLNDLFVHPDHRGKGVSIKLIERAKQLVKKSGACGMMLETEKSNDIGNNLYPRTGFVLNEGSNFYEWNV